MFINIDTHTHLICVYVVCIMMRDVNSYGERGFTKFQKTMDRVWNGVV